MNNNIFELTAGAIGQLQGPFSQGTSFNLINNSDIANIKIGISIGEKDLMREDTIGDFYFIIDNEEIHMKFSIDEKRQEKFELLEKIKNNTITEEEKEDLINFEPQFLLTKSCLYETERNTEISTISFPVGAPASTIIEYSLQKIGD